MQRRDHDHRHLPPKHRPVTGGFECECGASFSTPLGIERHRAMCPESRRNGGGSA